MSLNVFLCLGMQVLSEAMKKKTENGLLAKSILARGEAIPEEMIVNLIEDKLRSAEVAHQGMWIYAD